MCEPSLNNRKPYRSRDLKAQAKKSAYQRNKDITPNKNLHGTWCASHVPVLRHASGAPKKRRQFVESYSKPANFRGPERAHHFSSSPRKDKKTGKAIIIKTPVRGRLGREIKFAEQLTHDVFRVTTLRSGERIKPSRRRK